LTLLGFKERFVPAVEARTKKHTIRAGRLRFKVGDAIQIWTGPYRPGMRRKLFDVDPVVTKIEAIEIGNMIVIVDGKQLHSRQIHDLVMADGFDSIAQFFGFFTSVKRPTFTGHIIHWDWT